MDFENKKTIHLNSQPAPSGLTFKLFDNPIVKVFFFFIPFTYALTFKIGFPLKISEIALFLILGFLLFVPAFKIYIQKQLLFKVLAGFIAICFLSVLLNLYWPYGYRLNEYESRFGYGFDSIMKFIYLLLAFAAFIVSSNAFAVNKKVYITIFIYGAIAASLYSWYLFLSSLLHIPYILLPGMDQKPQVINLSIGEIVRSGTFKEGNFMGLFLLIAAVIAMYAGKVRTSYFLLLSILTTVSSMGIVCGFLFLVLYHFKKLFTKKNIIKLFVFFSALSIIFLILMGNKDFNFLITSKLTGSTTKITNPAEYSKVDRLNSTAVAYRIGINNSLLGVGLSNYSLHYNKYNYDRRFDRTGKLIPNNIYLEVFAETGIIGLLFFLSFLYLLYKKTKYDHTNILRYGFILSLLYFLAFPTFTIFFIWVFWGLISSLPISYASGNN